MATITSKLQVTVPRDIAERYGLKPGDEIAFVEAGDIIHVIPPSGRRLPLPAPERLRLFDASIQRQREREAAAGKVEIEADRGWTREDLYDDARGRAR